MSVCLSVVLSVKKSKLAIMSISWLRPYYLSIVIPQTIINELLVGTVPLENHLPQLYSKKNKNKLGLSWAKLSTAGVKLS